LTRYLWRISNHADLSGRGGLLGEGRWHRKGVSVVYCSDHPSTALLEVLVHIDAEDISSTYQLLKIRCPDDLPTYSASEGRGTFDDVAYTRKLGSTLLASEQYCLLDVPSVVMPVARNILINPLHPAASEIGIEAKFEFAFDQRLLKRDG
jgi:RES domain-containing protein